MPRSLASFDKHGRILCYATPKQIALIELKDNTRERQQQRIEDPSTQSFIRKVNWNEFHKNGPKPSFKLLNPVTKVNNEYLLVYLAPQMHDMLRLRFRRKADGQRKSGSSDHIGRGERRGLRSGQKSANGVPIFFYPSHRYRRNTKSYSTGRK
jgi:hypothetical protein